MFSPDVLQDLPVPRLPLLKLGVLNGGGEVISPHTGIVACQGGNLILVGSIRLTVDRSDNLVITSDCSSAVLFIIHQWRRQRSKGARSFRGQKILQPGDPDALFFKTVYDLF